MDSLMQYVRKRRGGHRVKSGVLFARKLKVGRTAKVLVGWSKCKLTVDKFDADRGMEIASARIDAHLAKEREKHDVPPSMVDEVKEFKERCKRYFKVKTVELV